MPPRWFCVLVAICWLAMTGWLLHDLLPSWLPGEPPPFHIDPVDEVHKGTVPKISWKVYHQGKSDPMPQPIFNAETWVDYLAQDDTYVLQARLKATPKDAKLKPFHVARIFKVEMLTSEYRVTRSGQLRSLRAEVKATPQFELFNKEVSSLLRPFLKASPAPGAKKSSIPPDPLELLVEGEVHGDQFVAHCRAGSSSLTQPMQFDLPPTPVSHTRSVLMPLHPVNRIRGLRPGQSWRQPLVDPLRDAFASLPGVAGGVRSLQARVLPQPQKLTQGDSEVSCLVIEYSDDEQELMGRTWVEQDSEQVQQQEAFIEDGRWIMKRELPHRGLRGSS
jgi:hypothetical protein